MDGEEAVARVQSHEHSGDEADPTRYADRSISTSMSESRYGRSGLTTGENGADSQRVRKEPHTG